MALARFRLIFRVRDGQRKGSAGGMDVSGQVCSALERNGQSRARRTSKDQSQRRAGPDRDCSKRTVTKVEADLAQAKHMARKRHGRASDAQTEKGKTREGHDRIMPKKDIAEFD